MNSSLRELSFEEIESVAGGTVYCDPCYCYCPCPEPEPEPTNTKGNNGFGQEKRGIHDPAAPGRGGGNGFTGSDNDPAGSSIR